MSSRAKELDGLVGRIQSGRRVSSIHKEFAERAHLIRWFHERSTKELKAMKAALDAMNANKAKR